MRCSPGLVCLPGAENRSMIHLLFLSAVAGRNPVKADFEPRLLSLFYHDSTLRFITSLSVCYQWLADKFKNRGKVSDIMGDTK